MFIFPGWEKKGRIYSCNNNVFFKSHCTRPIPYLIAKDRLRIYFSSRNELDIPYPTYIDVDPLNPSNILYINELPLMNLGREGTFDDSGVTPVSILSDASGRLLMFYVGWKRRRYGGVTIEASIGYAELVKNGTKMVRLFEGPVLGQDPYHPILVAAPFVVKSQDYYRMWYCSGTEWKKTDHGSEMIYTVFEAHSHDLIHWKQQSSQPAISFAYDGEVISAPWVIKTPESLIMWYSTRGSKTIEDKNYSSGIAISKDGVAWTRHDPMVGIEKSIEGWDSEMICYPAVINCGNETYMFYSGNGVGKGGIGYARSTKYINIIDW